MADRDAAPYYVLFDGSDAEVTALLEKGLDTGDVIKAESVEQLAQDSGVAGLADTFATYQAAAAAGTDGEFNKKAENLVPYQEGPFYLVSYVPSYVATMGRREDRRELPGRARRRVGHRRPVRHRRDDAPLHVRTTAASCATAPTPAPSPWAA